MNCKNLTVVLILVFSRQVWSAEPVTKELPADVAAVAEGGNEFATDLYARLASEKTSNLFFSPYSISTALAMTYAGARGQTAAEMAKVLHFPVSQAELHPASNKLRLLLASKEPTARFQLRVANRLWGQKGFHFVPEFLGVTKSDYGAELGLLDFGQSDAARQTINSWIETQTEWKIQDLIPPNVLNSDTRLVLTNAIYFKASWRYGFQKASTANSPFQVSEAKRIVVPTMHQTKDLRYGESKTVQMLELPYGEDGRLSMLILLPKAVDGLGDLEKVLTNQNLAKLPAILKMQEVNVHLPKFKMTSEFSLKGVLTLMGMPLAFSPNAANFSGMSTQEKLFISAVIHKAFVDVNEEGTEAAAATAVAMELAMARAPKSPIEFRADHPFVFFIRDTRTQCILFMGRVINPKE